MFIQTYVICLSLLYKDHEILKYVSEILIIFYILYGETKHEKIFFFFVFFLFPLYFSGSKRSLREK